MCQSDVMGNLREDYAKALIHMACVCDTATRTYALIFGMVELFPQECASLPLETPWYSAAFKKIRVFYRRHVVSVDEAVKFYLSAWENDPFVINWGNASSRVATTGLQSEATLTNYYLSDHSKLPFIATAWDVARVHSLYPVNNDSIWKSIAHKKVAEWLHERLGFGLLEDKYQQLLGSMHLVLPNPVYRRQRARLIPGDAAQPNQVQVRCVSRRNREEQRDTMLLCVVEKKSDGYASSTPIPLTGEYTRVPLMGNDEQVGYLLHCPRRGLLGYSEFARFIHKLHVSISAHEETLRLNLRTAENGEISTVEVNRYRVVSEATYGMDDIDCGEEQELGRRLKKNALAKEKQEQAVKLEQFICTEAEESKMHVRNILNRAAERVIIIDPYFSPLAVVHYIMTLQHMHIVPEIIVSAEGLKKSISLLFGQTWEDDETCPVSAMDDSSGLAPTPKTHAEIFDELLRSEKWQDKFKVQVMPGLGGFHDRFLIVDSTVWLSGHSFNDLGKRLSVIIRLPDGTLILDALDSMRSTEKMKPFAQWYNDHCHSRSEEEACDGQDN